MRRSHRQFQTRNWRHKQSQTVLQLPKIWFDRFRIQGLDLLYEAQLLGILVVSCLCIFA